MPQGEAPLTNSSVSGRDRELLMCCPESANGGGCHLRSPAWFRSLVLVGSSTSGLHAWSEGMMGTERVRRDGGGEVEPLSRRVQGTSVHPFLAAALEVVVLLWRAPTRLLAESQLQNEERTDKKSKKIIVRPFHENLLQKYKRYHKLQGFMFKIQEDQQLKCSAAMTMFHKIFYQLMSKHTQKNTSTNMDKSQYLLTIGFCFE